VRGHRTARLLKALGAAPLLAGLLAGGIAHGHCASAEQSRAERNDAVGVCTHFAHGWDIDATLPLIVDLGVGWVRDGIYWDQIELKKGVYRIPPETQRWIDRLHGAGIKILVSFSKPNSNYAPFDPDAYARAAAFIATEERGKVNAIEVLNEPNNASAGFRKVYGGEWAGFEKDGVTAPWMIKYVELLNKTAIAVKAANPEMKVIGLGANTEANLRGIEKGLAAQVDGVTDHPYSSRAEPEMLPFKRADLTEAGPGSALDLVYRGQTFSALVAAYRQQLKKYNAGEKQIWFTEWGYTTFHEDGRPNPGNFLGFSEQAQAAYLQRRVIEGLAFGVDRSFLYDLRNDGTLPDEVEHNFGLATADLRLKPAYAAFRAVVRVSANWRPMPEVSIEEAEKSETRTALRAYAFSDRNRQIIIAAWRIGAGDESIETTLAVPERLASSATATDLITGKELPVRVSGKREDAILLDLPLSGRAAIIQLKRP
jgi:hypothetical protein